MTLRTRLSLILAVGVAAAGIAFILLARVTVEQSLYADIDRELQREVRMFDEGRPMRGGHRDGGGRPDDGPRRGAGRMFGPGALIAQVTDRTGELQLQTSGVEAIGGLPDPRIRPRDRSPELRTIEVDDARYRLIEANVGSDQVVQVARPLTEVADFLVVLRGILVVAVGIALAAAVLLGRWAARATLAPVGQMTRAADRIANEPHDLSGTRIAPAFPDPELRAFAGAVNGMLDSIDEAHAQQRRFVSEASHELRTPLTSLAGNAAYLERYGTGMDDSSLEALAAVRRDVDRLTGIADGLTTLARLDAIPALQLEPVDVDAVARETVDRARTIHPGHEFDIECDAGTHLLDAELVRRIIGNLVDNAGRYTPGGTKITITLGRQRDGCSIVVADDGPGVPDGEIEHILGRFHRGAHAAGTAGTGLGLAIVDEAVDALGGTLELSSVEPHGLRCAVWLPSGSAT